MLLVLKKVLKHTKTHSDTQHTLVAFYLVCTSNSD